MIITTFFSIEHTISFIFKVLILTIEVPPIDKSWVFSFESQLYAEYTKIFLSFDHCILYSHSLTINFDASCIITYLYFSHNSVISRFYFHNFIEKFSKKHTSNYIVLKLKNIENVLKLNIKRYMTWKSMQNNTLNARSLWNFFKPAMIE